MTEPHASHVALFSAAWENPHDEAGFVARSVAGAVSRLADVDVLVPGPPGPRRGDGAFDPIAVGEPEAPGTAWPTPDKFVLPSPATYDVAIFVGPTAELRAVTRELTASTRTLTVVSSEEGADTSSLGDQLLVGMDPRHPRAKASASVHPVGLHVAVNPLATGQRHGGLGFTGFVLVLTDRSGPGDHGLPPTPAAAWLAARFAREVTVVLEGGRASVWEWRSLLGSIPVATRMDLWRLMSHASVIVDLSPGLLIGRECVESLRFGVPIVAPEGSTGARLAAAGGGLWYRDVAEMLECVEAAMDPSIGKVLAAQGRTAVEGWYGSPERFVERLDAVLFGVAEAWLP